MRLKKVKKNISKLFCALFMLGMNVYGVESQWNVYRSVPSSGNGQFNGQPFVNGPQNQGYGQQSTVLNGNGQFNGPPSVNGPQNQVYGAPRQEHVNGQTSASLYHSQVYGAPRQEHVNGQQKMLSQSAYTHSKEKLLDTNTEHNEGNYFDQSLTKALAGNKAAMSMIKALTSQDSDTQPTIDMWRDACNKVMHATLQGNSNGLDIFKHLTSDECHTKSNAMGSDIRELMLKSEIAGSDFLEPIVNSTVNIEKSEHSNELKTLAHGLSFSMLTYLTSPDCKVPPSQEAVDKLFREKATQYLEKECEKHEYSASKDSALKGFKANLVKMKNESFEPTYVIKYLTSDYCSVRPSQKEVDSFFAQLINAYTETKYFGLEALESTRDRFFNAIIHLISNKCNRHPSLQIVHDSIEALTQADWKRKGDIESAILDLERERKDIKSNQSTKILNLSLIETYRTSLEDCQLLYLQEILTMYLQTLPEASEHIREADSKKFFKYCTDQSERFDKVMKIIKTVDPKDQFTI